MDNLISSYLYPVRFIAFNDDILATFDGQSMASQSRKARVTILMF
ncbi:Uncharacterised protein [Salmonella enterica subsp. enterica serovar Typhi]|nr:Uncharacterised protein [Salmonella enterica subsp. enterica serovar Typhi]CGC14982.1 Uncharacterised protein [Salmonella enterica subsp. enterica serovar Typhi]CHY34483.1 Uncharacterised protein [Salmonella enterica subsp. enterica serovar Typhi]CWX93256.1 Uncharacterised protein [Salmonella enterica subsp. enterica serovar Typhi]